MTEKVKPQPHALLQKPEEISIAYRDELMAAHTDYIQSLTNHFQSQATLLSPAFDIHLDYFSDNGGNLDDTAPKEIDGFLRANANAISALSGIKKPGYKQHNTLSQDWISGGFELAQTTRLSLMGVGNVTFLNCAPRLDERGTSDNKSNNGEPVYVAILPNGHVISANSRYNFIFFRDMVENGSLEIFEANVQTDGTQFRSRDIFPTHALVLTNLLTQNIELWKPEMDLEQRRELLSKTGFIDLEKPLTADQIPQLKQFTAAAIDVHGNIKTNTRLSELDTETIEKLKAEPFHISINGIEVKAEFTERMFDRATGELGISKGSSGSNWQGANHGDGFLEVSIIGRSAIEALHLQPGDLKKQITILLPGITEEANDNLANTPMPEEPAENAL